MDNMINSLKEYVRKISNDRGLLIKIAVIILVITAAIVVRITNNNNNNEIIIESSSNSNEIVETSMYVDISGEVKNPGVYRFDSGTRLYEVINKAGGLTKLADKNGINQAELIEDGQKIIIPSTSNEETESSIPNNSSALINLNTASREELMNITGVGEVIADRIIEYRCNNRFKSIEDIMNIKGIGNATFEKMKSQITV